MARAKGYQAIVARKKGSTWGTAVACAAGSGVAVTSIETPGNLAQADNMQINGTVQPEHQISGNTAVSVTLRGNLRYEGICEYIMAQVMGTSPVPSVVDVSGQQHKLKVLDDTEGIFDTVAYELVKDTKVVEIPSVKWTQFTVRGRSGNPIEFEAQGIGDDYLYGTSAVNTLVTIDTTTMSANNEVAHFKHSVTYMNAQNGADFNTASDDPGCVGWEFTVSRPHEAVFSTLRPGLSSEPRPTGFFDVSGSFDFADLDATRNGPIVLAQKAGTAQKAKIILTGTTLCGNATQKYTMNFWFPYISLLDGKPGVTGPEGLTWSIPWKSTKVATIPTGFTAGYVDSISIDLFNKIATGLLA